MKQQEKKNFLWNGKNKRTASHTQAKKKTHFCVLDFLNGGSDEIRTRDLLRDRQAL